MHGPHQVAQNSMTYTLPGSNRVTGCASPGPLLSQCSTFSSGAWEPTVNSSSAARQAAPLKPKNKHKANCKRRFIARHLPAQKHRCIRSIHLTKKGPMKPLVHRPLCVIVAVRMFALL